MMILPVFSARAVYDVPATNRIDWASYCGIPGGIPSRTTIFTNMTVGATSAQINSAITACPSNQVVFLPAGLYNLSGSLTFATKSHKTLRGAGTNKTILNITSGFISSDQYGWSGAANLASGFTKGSTSVVFSATPNAQITPGNLMKFRMEDDTNFVFATAGSFPRRNVEFTVRVLTKSGTTVTFEPPLPWNLTNFNPQAEYLNGGPGLQRFGLEDMTITNSSGASATIQYVGTRQCWFKNIEVVKAADMSINLVDCLQTEVRDCVVKDVLNWPNQSDGFGVFLDGGSYWLVAGSIFLKVGNPILLKNSASAGAILYNYFDYTAFVGVDRQLPDINFGHGAHNMMVLAEGNVCAKIQHDAYHGSASHLTMFRNFVHGTNGSSTIVNWKIPIDILRGTYWCYVVGNILGDASWTNDASFKYSITGSGAYTDHGIFRLGYPNSGNASLTETAGNAWIDDYAWFDPYPDLKVTNTMTIHMNYDYFTHSQRVYGSEDQTLPDSFFFTSQPTDLTTKWPAFNPASPLTAHPTNTQAGHRVWYGTNFVASGGEEPPPEPTVTTIAGQTVRKAKPR